MPGEHFNVKENQLISLQVETVIFTDLKNHNLTLMSVGYEEEAAKLLLQRLLCIFDKNIPGLEKYLMILDKYSDLLTMQEERDLETFLKEKHTLIEYRKVCKWIHRG